NTYTSQIYTLSLHDALPILKQTDKPQIIFIDYLQLMKSDIPTNDRRVEVETISRDLKNIANETGSIIVLLSQLSRAVESRNDKRDRKSTRLNSSHVSISYAV